MREGARGEREVWGEGRLTGGAHREKAAAVLIAVRTARVGAGGGELGPRLGRRAGPRRGGG
jgi:hypothetical protein